MLTRFGKMRDWPESKLHLNEATSQKINSVLIGLVLSPTLSSELNGANEQTSCRITPTVLLLFLLSCFMVYRNAAMVTQPATRVSLIHRGC